MAAIGWLYVNASVMLFEDIASSEVAEQQVSLT